MQFKIKKELSAGRFYVLPILAEFSEDDKIKAVKMGYPTLKLKYQNGVDFEVGIQKLKDYNIYNMYGFYTQKEADLYAENIKKQIEKVKSDWDNFEDNWSNEEAV